MTKARQATWEQLTPLGWLVPAVTSWPLYMAECRAWHGLGGMQYWVVSGFLSCKELGHGLCCLPLATAMWMTGGRLWKSEFTHKETEAQRTRCVAQAHVSCAEMVLRSMSLDSIFFPLLQHIDFWVKQYITYFSQEKTAPENLIIFPFLIYWLSFQIFPLLFFLVCKWVSLMAESSQQIPLRFEK